ncbi:MAG: transglutaminase-like cysteine peptidase [gamma proteobacterium symbiont of Bathyaustriella thionipta]|nr:transglutaminase-like cysteine peptidase [gamma proteobacterium symbiont of Bathyaustriella thionipta]MCU7958163.1 transglutaminase-like cysteine peptidase [gamma proteobacterium symbiont of Bathyaustriella thionipta]MCU7966428.1 transglutaminase-like cysteine peptidase [gamma proteobacterium symbiont of Bathyaustriella thionipta]
MKNYLNRIVSLLTHLFMLFFFLPGGISFASKTLAEANHNINVEHDKETSRRFNEWEKLLFHNLGKSTNEKLKLVNDFFNKMKWSDDKEIWNKKDYWATPIESLIKNSGDCEDFSIAKYFTLLAMDIPEEQLRITYVILDNSQGHMVLFYYPDIHSEPLVLDNMRNDILKKSNRTDIKYKFSFNDDGLWLKGNYTSVPDEKNIIKKWSQMVDRIKLE